LLGRDAVSAFRLDGRTRAYVFDEPWVPCADGNLLVKAASGSDFLTPVFGWEYHRIAKAGAKIELKRRETLAAQKGISCSSEA
jgi:hypothetical protein